MKFLGRDQFGFIYAEMDFGVNCILSLRKRKGVAEVYEDDIYVGVINTKRTAKGTLHKLNEIYKGQRWYRIPRYL